MSYKPFHLVFLFLFIIFSVWAGKILLTATPLSNVPGAQTFGRGL